MVHGFFGLTVYLLLESFSNFYPVYNPNYQRTVFLMKRAPDYNTESDLNQLIRAIKI
jgi:hypothetical protein